MKTKCPKCGGKAKLESQVDERFYFWHCLACGWRYVTHA